MDVVVPRDKYQGGVGGREREAFRRESLWLAVAVYCPLERSEAVDEEERGCGSLRGEPPTTLRQWGQPGGEMTTIPGRPNCLSEILASSGSRCLRHCSSENRQTGHRPGERPR